MTKGNVRFANEAQLDELRIAVQKSVNKLRGRIEAQAAQKWIGKSVALDRFVEQLLPGPDETGPSTRLVSGGYKLVLPPTGGERTIATAKSVFTGGINADFWSANTHSAPTDATYVEVHEQIRNETFKDIFAGFEGRFTQDQVIAFAEHHTGWIDHPNVWAILLPFMVNEECFVAYINKNKYGFCVGMLPFAHDGVWNKELRYRIAVPVGYCPPHRTLRAA